MSEATAGDDDRTREMVNKRATKGDKPCARSSCEANPGDEEQINGSLRAGEAHALGIDRQGRRRQRRKGGGSSVLRESYRIDGDGVAHADLEKLVRRPGFKSSARKIIERNRLLKSGM